MARDKAVLVEQGSLRFTRGEPGYFRSSSFGKRGFCPSCGSRLVWAAVEAADGLPRHPESEMEAVIAGWKEEAAPG